MPFFSGKFSPKRTTPRRIVKSESDLSTLVLASNETAKKESSEPADEIKIVLGDQIIRFENGEWIPETGTVGGTFKENVMLKKRVNKLEEENNMLRIKYEVLLDMLTKTTEDFHLQTKEIERLRALTDNSKQFSAKNRNK